MTVELNDPTLKLRSCVKDEVTALGSLSLTVHIVSVDLKQHLELNTLSLSELRSCVKVEMTVLGSLSLIVHMVSVGLKQHWT